MPPIVPGYLYVAEPAVSPRQHDAFNVYTYDF